MRITFIIITAFTLISCSITSNKIYDKTSYALKSIDSDPIKVKEYVLAKKYHYIKTADSSGTAYIRIFNPDLRQINSLETFQSKSCKLREGQAWYWYDNGVLRESGQYADGKRHGKWKEYYYPTGDLKAEGYYRNGSKVGQWTGFDPKGWRSQTITYTPGNPHRRFTKYDSSGQIIHEGVFHRDKAFRQMFHSPNSSYPVDFDVLPCFSICSVLKTKESRDSCTKNNLLLHIFSNVRYPEKARYHSIMGTSLFRCTIAKDGSIKYIQTMVGVCKEIEEECKSLLQSMPAWEPATNDGTAVEAQITIPIKFEIQSGRVYSISSP